MQGIVNRHRPMIKIPRGAYKSRQILSNPSKPASMKFRRVSFGVLFTLAATANASTSSCRCLYDQPCWPNESEFAKLATQISQPILHPLPPPFPCYPTSAPSGNCSEVIANYGSNIWRSDQPGAMQLTNYEVFIFPNKTILPGSSMWSGKCTTLLVSMLGLGPIFRPRLISQENIISSWW